MKCKIIKLLLLVAVYLYPQEISWEKIDDGLSFGEFTAFQKSDIGDSKVSVLKIDPAKYNFNLFSAKQKGEKIRTADKWAKEKGQIAVINAGMYRDDYATNCGYMKNFEFVNNGKLAKDYKSIIAFNRKDESVPAIQIIDLEGNNWENLKEKYNSFSQSLRLINSKQNNVWSQQKKRWSMVAIGIDKEGMALYIFCRSPYSVHDFIDIILKAKLNLYNAIYLEGGPEASFYVNHNGFVIEKMGSYETSFNENDSNDVFWEIPNVIGVSKK